MVLLATAIHIAVTTSRVAAVVNVHVTNRRRWWRRFYVWRSWWSNCRSAYKKCTKTDVFIDFCSMAINIYQLVGLVPGECC